MRLPPQAQRVFKGIIFDVYQWEQEQFDGSHATFEMLKRPATLSVIATQGDMILVAEEEQPLKGSFIGLFGGRVEEDEDPLAGAQRELLEETGLGSDAWELLKTYEPYTKMDWTVYLYVARNCYSKETARLDAGERIAVRRVTFEEFVSLVVSEQFWGKELALDVLRMEREGTLETFRQQIFGRSD